MSIARVTVIDIGKTNVKLALVDADTLAEVAVVTRTNEVLPGPPWPHFDVDAIWDFLLDALGRLHAEFGIDAITVTTHGASGALIGEDGQLVAPVLDYEHPGPEGLAAEYDAIRPPFSETGSPRLSMGLNLGAQFHWQFATQPGLKERTRTIVTYPQYWGLRLSGVAACDVSSLGAHTDLWNPHARRLSSLAERLGIADRIAPCLPANRVLGPILPEVARRTGLDPDTPVYCGIHDSNASLLPHIMRRKAPFTVVSTGTWVIVMTVGGAKVTLDPTRDTLVNVNALGAPVPSARFMGGREYKIILAGQNPDYDTAKLHEVAVKGPVLLPSIVGESGPFQGRQHHWVGGEPESGSAERAVAVGFYLAMMTAECLSLTGHRGPIVLEGPFGTNAAYCQMLSVAAGAPVLVAGGATGTSQGAAILALGADALPEEPDMNPVVPFDVSLLAGYADRWRRLVAQG